MKKRKYFNIEQLIKTYAIDTDDIAKVLFPRVKYPKQAFARIVSGEAELEYSQLEKLADYVGLSLSDMFEDQWKGYFKDGILRIKKGEVEAKFNCGGNFVSLYKNGEFIEHYVVNTALLSMKELLKKIESL